MVGDQSRLRGDSFCDSRHQNPRLSHPGQLSETGTRSGRKLNALVENDELLWCAS